MCLDKVDRGNRMKTITKCSRHPKYQAVFPPKSCLECRVIWLEKQFNALVSQYRAHSHFQREVGDLSKPTNY